MSKTMASLRDKSYSEEERRNVLVVLAFLEKHYPNSQQTQDSEVVLTYIESLYDVPLEYLRSAAMAYLNSSKCNWFPQPGDLRGLALDMLYKSQGLLPPQEVYGLILSEIRRVGYTQSPNLPPIAMLCVKSMGGWQQVCIGTQFSLQTFTQSYRELLKHYKDIDLLPPQQKTMLGLPGQNSRWLLEAAEENEN
mgnify:CR=1 FL=1